MLVRRGENVYYFFILNRFCRLAQPGRRLLSNQGYAGCRSELREAVRVCARLCWVSRRQSNWVLEGMLPVWDRWALSFAILPLQGELLATGFWLLAVSLGLLRAEFCNSAATGGATGFWLSATFGWYRRRCSNR